MEAAGGAEEARGEGEEEVHGGGDTTKRRGDAHTSMSMSEKRRLGGAHSHAARLCRGRPSRRTEPCGSKTSS